MNLRISYQASSRRRLFTGFKQNEVKDSEQTFPPLKNTLPLYSKEIKYQPQPFI